MNKSEEAAANNVSNGAPLHQIVPNVMLDEAQYMPGVATPQTTVILPDTAPNVSNNEQMPQMYSVNGLDETQFHMRDAGLRRKFFRSVFTVLLLQNIFALPFIEIFITVADEPFPLEWYAGFYVIAIAIFWGMYLCSGIRRFRPMNILGLSIATLLWCLLESIYATRLETRHALLSQLVTNVLIIGVIAFSKQNRFKVNNLNVMSFVCLIYIIVLALISICEPSAMRGFGISPLLYVIYAVYDMQLMLTGYHGYNLEPEDYVFAATNIYADITHLMWRIFKYLFLDQFIGMYKFLMACCAAEVC